MKQEDSAAFPPNNVVYLFIVYKLEKWSLDINTDFTLQNCLFGGYSGCDIGFD